MSCVPSHRGNTADGAGRIAHPNPRSREAGRVTAPDAEKFAHEWIDAWNAHDLDRVVSHYSAEVVFTSPIAAVRVPESHGVIRGIAALEEYWAGAVDAMIDLHFDLEHVLETCDGVTMVYRNHRGQLMAETLLFCSDGLVTVGYAAYEEGAPAR
jgi:hypothetical protein